MSLLQVDDALRHWLERHNVSLDIASHTDTGTWPAPVIGLADRLLAPATPSKMWKDVDPCACKLGSEGGIGAHALAGIVEEIFPDVIT